MSTPVLTASETAFYLRFRLGPIRSWSHFLSDCIRGRGGLHGMALMPCCRRRELGCFRPAYALDDVHAFVDAVLATVPGAGKASIKPTVVMIEPALLWRAAVNTFEDDGSRHDPDTHRKRRPRA